MCEAESGFAWSEAGVGQSYADGLNIPRLVWK